MSRKSSLYSDNVFINCPFDDQFASLLKAIVFCVFDSGFRARSALEVNDGAEIRFEKILRIISECKYGIHDLSRTDLDQGTGLPRFNMPLELGCFLGAKRYGTAKQKVKKALILDVEPYRYQMFISDIAGQDISSHDGDEDTAIRVVSEFLRDDSKRKSVPGAAIIQEHYKEFKALLPESAERLRLRVDELTFNDFCTLSVAWLKEMGEAD